MESQTKVTTRKRVNLTLVILAGLMLLSGIALAEEQPARQSVSTQGSKSAMDAGATGAITRDEHAALRTDGNRRENSRTPQLAKPGTASSASLNVDFWFYTADVVLFNDHDADGFYHGIDLLFDADTYFVAADVYAVIYLSLDGGPWNEYAATENFTIFGATSDDEYVIVTELVSGYPSGSYDMLIELFDAYDDTFLAYFGPEDTSELAFLPLEDADRDLPAEIPEVIVVRERGGGAFGFWLLLGLGGVAVRRLLRRTGSQ